MRQTRERTTRPNTTYATADAPTTGITVEDFDKLLEDIDEILEENVIEVVRLYRQCPGQ
jgi:CBS-domain-containing membrane protein